MENLRSWVKRGLLWMNLVDFAMNFSLLYPPDPLSDSNLLRGGRSSKFFIDLGSMLGLLLDLQVSPKEVEEVEVGLLC